MADRQVEGGLGDAEVGAGHRHGDPAWRGVGMRGNNSCGARLDGVRVPHGNLLGHEGDQIWYGSRRWLTARSKAAWAMPR
jgi:alkylation response protein AidB-like acyl-CoA dehydrogenase